MKNILGLCLSFFIFSCAFLISSCASQKKENVLFDSRLPFSDIRREMEEKTYLCSRSHVAELEALEKSVAKDPENLLQSEHYFNELIKELEDINFSEESRLLEKYTHSFLNYQPPATDLTQGLMLLIAESGAFNAQCSAKFKFYSLARKLIEFGKYLDSEKRAALVALITRSFQLKSPYSHSHLQAYLEASLMNGLVNEGYLKAHPDYKKDFALYKARLNSEKDRVRKLMLDKIDKKFETDAETEAWSKIKIEHAKEEFRSSRELKRDFLVLYKKLSFEPKTPEIPKPKESDAVLTADTMRESEFFKSAYLTPDIKDGEIQGFELVSVDANSPLLKLGLKKGDSILKINDEAMTSLPALSRQSTDLKKIKKIEVLRAGKKKILKPQ